MRLSIRIMKRNLRERSSITSARLGGVGGLSRNADTADAGEGGGGVSDKMLTLLTLNCAGVKSRCLQQKSKENNTNNH